MSAVRKDAAMKSRNRWGWLAVLVPVLVCLPCLAAPLIALGGAAALSAVGGSLTGNLWLVAAGLLAGVALAVGLVAVRRRARRTGAACCPPVVPSPEAAPEALLEVRR
jgi:hypothetical protein